MSMWAQFATKDPDGLVWYSMGLSINQTLLLQNSHWHVFTADKSISFLFISFSIYGTTEQRQTLRTPLVIKPHGFFRQEYIFVRPSSGLCVTDASKLRVPRRDACWRAVKRSLRDLTRKNARLKCAVMHFKGIWGSLLRREIATSCSMPLCKHNLCNWWTLMGFLRHSLSWNSHFDSAFTLHLSTLELNTRKSQA